MPMHEKIARVARISDLAKANVARRMTAEHGPMSARRLQLLTASELRQREPQLCEYC